jgi:hypothetical protein
MLTLQTEMMDKRWAATGGEASPQQIKVYQTTVDTLRRTLESLGMHRRPRDVTPTLIDALKANPP